MLFFYLKNNFLILKMYWRFFSKCGGVQLFKNKIRGQIKESILDHVNVADPFKISDIKGTRPIFGDHNLITFTINRGKENIPYTIRRDWRKYSKESLNDELCNINWKYVALHKISKKL